MGEKISEQMGASLEFNTAGTRLVVGEGYLANFMGTDSVRVYDLSAENELIEIGEFSEQYIHEKVKISSDGNFIMYNANSVFSSSIKVLEFDSNSGGWNQKGQTLTGATNSELAINMNGNRIAYSTPSFSASVSVFDYDSNLNRWSQIDVISGPSYFGFSLAMSRDGNFMAVGSFEGCGQQFSTCASGKVSFFYYNPTVESFFEVVPLSANQQSSIVERDRDSNKHQFGNTLMIDDSSSILSVGGFDVDKKETIMKVYDLNKLMYPKCVASNPDAIGDGSCDFFYLGNDSEECGWDGGDCIVSGYPDCHGVNPSFIGDSECLPYAPYNTIECGNDGGDCDR